MITYFGVMPLQITMTYNDSLSTHIKIIGGLGRLVYPHTDCEGNVIRKEKIPFGELNLIVDHKIKDKPIRIGVNTNLIITRNKSESTRDNETGNYDWSTDYSPIYGVICNPYINAEWKYFAFGIGVVSTQSFIKNNDDNNNNFNGIGSLYLRLGNPQKFYADASLGHKPPIYVGSWLKAGVGFRLSEYNQWWIGTGGIPYDNLGLIISTDYKIRSRLYLGALIYYGRYYSISQGGISFGVTYGLNKRKN